MSPKLVRSVLKKDKPGNQNYGLHTYKKSNKKRLLPLGRGKKTCCFMACLVAAVLMAVGRSIQFNSSWTDWGASMAAHSTNNVNTNYDTAAPLVAAQVVHLLPPSALRNDDVDTGTWWQSVSSFQRFPVTKIRAATAATAGTRGHQSVASSAATSGMEDVVYRDHVVMTTNWLDFAVEAVPEYHSHFMAQRDPTPLLVKEEMAFYPILQQQMQTFIQRHAQSTTATSPSSSQEEDAARQTIAIIPFTMQPQPQQSLPNEGVSSSNSSSSSSHGRHQPQELQVQALAATLASLRAVGMGRAVVVGLATDHKWFMSAVEQLSVVAAAAASASPSSRDSSHGSSSMQIAFCVAPGINSQVLSNKDHTAIWELLQRQALHGLDMAFRMSPSLLGAPINEWLGDSMTHPWRYVYWTQPGLLLNCRAAAVPTLQQALDQGAILTPHRLQPIPHASDFPTSQQQQTTKPPEMLLLVPAEGTFAVVQDLRPVVSACCDAGIDNRPALRVKTRAADCPAAAGSKNKDKAWWQCGFGNGDPNISLRKHSQTVQDRHAQKVPYDWIRMQEGTGISMMAASASARMCVPVASGMCGPYASIVSAPSLSSSTTLSGLSGTESITAPLEPNLVKSQAPSNVVPVDPEAQVKTPQSVPATNDIVPAKSQPPTEPKAQEVKTKDSPVKGIEPDVTVLFTRIPDIKGGDWYSGMFWQNMNNFYQLRPVSFGSLETVSFQAFDNSRKTRMTRDWFDLAVEHLSKYHRHFEVDRDKSRIPYDIMRSQLSEYIKKAKPYPTQNDLAPASTIVLVPYTTKSTLKSAPEYNSNHEKDAVLRVDAFAATLVSLWQIGMGRVVVVGQVAEDGVFASKVFDTVREKSKDSIELAFVIGSNATTGMKNNAMMPMQAVGGLQLALQSKFNESLTLQWLGAKPKRWMYVYYTEPDLILNSRPDAMATLTAELDKGNRLAAHRLQPIPHEIDFPGYDNLRKIVPAIGNFSNIVEVDTSKTACCDAGGGKPGREIPQKEW